MKKNIMSYGSGNFNSLMFKGLPILKDEEITTETWYLRKDGKHFDMRFKSSKEQLKKLHKPWWDITLQKVADFLGSPKIIDTHMSWRHYLNPVKQIRHRFTGIWYL